jgi:hypothetical protein
MRSERAGVERGLCGGSDSAEVYVYVECALRIRSRRGFGNGYWCAYLLRWRGVRRRVRVRLGGRGRGRNGGAHGSATERSPHDLVGEAEQREVELLERPHVVHEHSREAVAHDCVARVRIEELARRCGLGGMFATRCKKQVRQIDKLVLEHLDEAQEGEAQITVEEMDAQRNWEVGG